MSGNSEVPPIERVLGALADPTRRQLVDRLARCGEATATALAAEMSVTRQAVVQHLAILEAACLVKGQRIGRERRFVVCPQRLTETARWMDSLAAQWDSRLTAIKRIAERAHPVGLESQGSKRQTNSKRLTVRNPKT
ncbi:DNA-binding transcriptional regulator, ArsR family [Paenibacillus sp. GP183]|nr:DNA-binding transcriptional regulator, ArsR family [Paenibacillus sp. GP183]